MNLNLYGLLVGSGFAIFWLLFEHLLRSISPKRERHFTIGLLLVAFGALFGARAYHLWTDWNLYRTAPLMDLFAIWNGGLGIYGALLGGLLGLMLWKKWFATDLSWRQILDAAAFAAPFGQAVGRWGNYANHELFGLPTNAPWAIHIPVSNRPAEYWQFSHFHPLFLYESLALLLIGGFFVLLRKRFADIFPFGTGWFLGCYLFAYGSIRFCLELLRLESAPGWFGLTIAQWVSLFATGVGLLLFSHAFRLQWKGDETTSNAPPSSAGSPRRRSAGRTKRSGAKSGKRK